MTKPFIFVVVAMGAAGVVAGAVWAALAPAVHGAVALTRTGERVHVYLGREGDHFFVSAAMMAGLLAALGLIAAVWAWQLRRRRGPWMVVALTVGGLVAACFATGVGWLLARLRYGGGVDIPGAPVSPEHRVHYVIEAPAVFFGPAPIQALVTLLLPAALAALTYALVAAASAHDDLGVKPSVPETVG